MTTESANAALIADVQSLLEDHARFQDPYPLYARARSTLPVTAAGSVRFATSYKDVVALYRHEKLSRQQAARAESAAHSRETNDQTLKDARAAWTRMMINQDDPGHRRIRRILEVAFRPTQVAAWRSIMKRIADELVESVRGRERFDFRAELAYPLPERIICALMGVPYEDHALWGAWTDAVVASARTSKPSIETMAAVDEAHKNFYLYFRDLIAARRSGLADDLVSLLISAEDEDGNKLEELEVLGSLQMLIQAGHETTANLITNGMYTLLRHPDQYDLLRNDPSLVGSAIEEMLRYESPAHWSLPRIALEDVIVDGGAVPRGSTVVLALNAANRDPSMFDNPDMFDIRRKSNRHVAFAAGPHFCLGNQFARLEASTMFHAIVTQLPRLKLDGQPRFKSTFVRALDTLPVAIDYSMGR